MSQIDWSKTFGQVMLETYAQKKRREVANRKEWDKYVNQEKGMKGQEYIDHTRKSGVVKHDIKMSQRLLGRNVSLLFAGEQRTGTQKRLFIVHVTNYSDKHRSYIQTPSRRAGSFQHYLKLETQTPGLQAIIVRQNTAKHYLEPNFSSKAEVYKVYKEMCLEDSVTPLSTFAFSRTMDDMNIGFT
nr:unnamed protein product [Callosobruchus analis]